MAPADVIRLLRADARPGLTRVHLKGLQRDLFLRNQTSDLSCFEKVFCEQEYFVTPATPPRFIVDGGANIGMATLFFAWKYPASKIVAVEPEPGNFELLQKNCVGLADVSLMQAALWPEERNLVIQDPAAANWAFSVTESGDQSTLSLAVTAVTIPEILRRHSAAEIDILKLDIECAELELFSKGTEHWLHRVNFLIIELHDRFRTGCARAFYSAIVRFPFAQETRGENVIIHFSHPATDEAGKAVRQVA